MATPIGTMLCVGMLSLATGILLLAAVITACFAPPIDVVRSNIQPQRGQDRGLGGRRHMTTAA